MNTQSILPDPVPPIPAAPALLTAAEFCEKYGNHGYELVQGRVHDPNASREDGELQEVTVPWQSHGFICALIARLIGNFVSENRLGRVTSNDSWIRTGVNPDSLRGPDVYYFSYERLPPGKIPQGLLPVNPDLVVEVRSPSDSWTEMFTKVVEYLRAGIRAVVILDEETVTASVYRPQALQQTFHAADTLTVPEILPGFSVLVGTLFE
jgi:Uma2 family endonuclease